MPDPNSNSTATPIDPDQMAQFRSMMVDAEGIRPTVYRDSQGNLTVGIGHEVRPEDGLRLGDTIAPDQIEAFFQQDAKRALNAAKAQAQNIGITDPGFVPPLASVNYQLGPNWPQTFRKTWGAMAAGDYATAAMEAGRSRWMQQAPERVRAFQNALLALPPRADEGDDGDDGDDETQGDPGM